jgi:hypothetical protein
MQDDVKPRVRVTGLRRREDTVLRLGGIGDNFHTTWGPDDRQYTAVDDGTGWSAEPRYAFNTRLWSIEGGPEDAVFADVEGYPKLDHDSDLPRYYCFGTLAVGEHIYQFLSTQEISDSDLLFIGAKVIHSPDLGATWHNQDGGAVHWETWEERNRDTMMFYREPQNAFSVVSLLQMGKGYSLNRDGYVYGYSSNGLIDREINELVMFRVPTDRVLDRAAYEFFAGLRADGDADWTADNEDRAVVVRFPLGYATPHAHTWVPSVVYNEPLDLYIMANFGMAWAPPGEGFAEHPSYLGFWTAPNPWGPWTQIHEETEWLPGGDAGARAYEAQIMPKWIADDGLSFWLVWTDIQALGEEDLTRTPYWTRWPYYAMNTQRVDLIVE